GLLPGLSPELSTASSAPEAPAIPVNITLNISLNPEFAEPTVLPAESPVISSPAPAAVPEAMLLVQKCASCGFPVSGGRTHCLDCEKKDSEKQREREQGASSDSAADSGGIRAGLSRKLGAPTRILAGEPHQSVGDRRPDIGHPGRNRRLSVTKLR